MATCEAELIESAAHGDQEAFRNLWEDHHAIAMEAALAEEVTQGAFLLAWRGLPRRLSRPARSGRTQPGATAQKVGRAIPGRTH